MYYKRPSACQSLKKTVGLYNCELLINASHDQIIRRTSRWIYPLVALHWKYLTILTVGLIDEGRRLEAIPWLIISLKGNPLTFPRHFLDFFKECLQFNGRSFLLHDD